jgi:hypothetical protein
MTRAELIAERETIGDMLAVALGHFDAVLERLNADPPPKKTKPKTKKGK